MSGYSVKRLRERAKMMRLASERLDEAADDLEQNGYRPRMALRPYRDDPDRLDDVVVENVRMFRAEMMSDGQLWMACYFDDGPESDEIHFLASAGKRGTAQLTLSATTTPDDWIDIDASACAPAPDPTPEPEEGGPCCARCGRDPARVGLCRNSECPHNQAPR